VALLKAREAAERLGVSISTLYALKCASVLLPVRCGVSKGYRWTESDVQSFVDSRREKASTEAAECGEEVPRGS
jgi:predicted DNA-binding transcriptional regulator AlpA